MRACCWLAIINLIVFDLTSETIVHTIVANSVPFGGVVLSNGSVVLGQSTLSPAIWCCLPPYNNARPTYTPSVAATPLDELSTYTQDVIHDTRSDGLFTTNDGTGIQYLTLNPLSSTVVLSLGSASRMRIAMVDFIHCSGPIYGILIAAELGHKMIFLPLTAGLPPVGGTAIDVAGDGTDGNVDGVGSAVRFGATGFVAAARTAPAWFVGGWYSECIRIAVFTADTPVTLELTSPIVTAGKQPYGVATTKDDSILYAATYNSQDILTVLNPLSGSPTLGPTVSTASSSIRKITLHPGCESLLLLGAGQLIVYNLTSRSTVVAIDTPGAFSATGSAILTNGTVVMFGGTAAALASWCCVPSYNTSTKLSFAPTESKYTLTVSSSNTRDIIYDTRSDGLFTSNDTDIQYLSFNPHEKQLCLPTIWGEWNFSSNGRLPYLRSSAHLWYPHHAPIRAENVLSSTHSSCSWSATRCGHCHQRCWRRH